MGRSFNSSRRHTIDFQIKLLGALSVGDVRTGTIPSLLPSQKHYPKAYGKMGLDVNREALAKFCSEFRVKIAQNAEPEKMNIFAVLNP
ncbi:MAG: hypothetical protein V1736_05145 [Pseudomonadota bacterium]